jgi:hypothetical protein
MHWHGHNDGSDVWQILGNDLSILQMATTSKPPCCAVCYLLALMSTFVPHGQHVSYFDRIVYYNRFFLVSKNEQKALGDQREELLQVSQASPDMA